VKGAGELRLRPNNEKKNNMAFKEQFNRIGDGLREYTAVFLDRATKMQIDPRLEKELAIAVFFKALHEVIYREQPIDFDALEEIKKKLGIAPAN
jgi:hypothetical protein